MAEEVVVVEGYKEKEYVVKRNEEEIEEGYVKEAESD